MIFYLSFIHVEQLTTLIMAKNLSPDLQSEKKDRKKVIAKSVFANLAAFGAYMLLKKYANKPGAYLYGALAGFVINIKINCPVNKPSMTVQTNKKNIQDSTPEQ